MNQEHNCMRFSQALNAYSGKTIQPLKNFSTNIHKGKRVMSFGIFTPLAHEMIARADVREGIVLHPFFCDEHTEGVSVYRYEIGTEHGVSVLLGLECEALSELVAELDVGYIVNESSLCDEEVECVQEFVREGGVLLLGRDLYLHPQSAFIAQILGNVAKQRDIEIFVQDLLEPCAVSKESMVGNALDSTILEELPENNGAFGYVCLESEVPKAFAYTKMGLEKRELLSPESFKAILKVAREGVYQMRFCYEDLRDSKELVTTQECGLRFFPSIKGTIGCLPSAEVVHYPFVRIVALQE